MGRKKWEAQTEVTPDLAAFREKRKWQINLRRYVLEKSPCPAYAPYFGLDIENIRLWFSTQFSEDLGWGDFGQRWQFEHVVPVVYFDHSAEEELRLCWNFINLRVRDMSELKQHHVDLLGAKTYFEQLFEKSSYGPAKKMIDKIRSIESQQSVNIDPQANFLKERKQYLAELGTYASFEFELLNHGKSVQEVRNEIEFLQKNIRPRRSN